MDIEELNCELNKLWKQKITASKVVDRLNAKIRILELVRDYDIIQETEETFRQ